MGNFDSAFSDKLRLQSWTLYAIGMLAIITRLYARARKLGIANYQADDYLVLLVAVLYTALIVCLNVIASGGGSNLYPPELEGTFTELEIEERVFGSKIVVISEQAMLNVIYAVKVCMLIMYTRLTLGLRDGRIVRWLAAYVAIGWFATEMTFFAACRPFSGYWAVPPPNPQCTTLEHYAIIQGSFNISADLLMIWIPFPLLRALRLPWRKKIVLVLIFSLGVFVIIAAFMTKVFNLTDVYNPDYMLWYVREASVAVYVSQIPMIWSMLRDFFPGLRHLSPGIDRTTLRNPNAYNRTATNSRYTMGRASGVPGMASYQHFSSMKPPSHPMLVATKKASMSSMDTSTQDGSIPSLSRGRHYSNPELGRMPSSRSMSGRFHADVELGIPHWLDGHPERDSEDEIEQVRDVLEDDKEVALPRNESAASNDSQKRSLASQPSSSSLQPPSRAASASSSTGRGSSLERSPSQQATDTTFRLIQMEKEAKEEVMMGGIKVLTTVEVREEVADPKVANARKGRAIGLW